jgi:hypothetical protein
MLVHVRTPDAKELDDEMYRLEFLVPDGVEGLAEQNLEKKKRFLFENLSYLLKHTPQAAVLHPKAQFPDNDALSTLHRGGPPANKQRVVLHYHPSFIEGWHLVGAPSLYDLTWFSLAGAAQTVRLVNPDGTELFIKDRYGWDQEETTAAETVPA